MLSPGSRAVTYGCFGSPGSSCCSFREDRGSCRAPTGLQGGVAGRGPRAGTQTWAKQGWEGRDAEQAKSRCETDGWERQRSNQRIVQIVTLIMRGES